MGLSQITQSINETAKSLLNAGNIDQGERMALFAACEKLKAAMETPVEAVFRIMFGVFPSLSLRHINLDGLRWLNGLLI